MEAKIEECRQRWLRAPGSRAFVPLADLLRQASRHSEALSILDEGLARHPNSSAGLVILALTLAASGQEAQGADAALRVLEIDPENLVALQLLAAEKRRCGEWSEAAEYYERLAQLEPDENKWPAALMSLWEMRRDAAPSTPVAETDGFATMTLVELCLAQGYREKAVTLLRRMLVERPDDPGIRGRLAALQEADPMGPTRADGPPVEHAVDHQGERDRAPVERRIAARQQFADWIDRIREDRGVAP